MATNIMACAFFKKNKHVIQLENIIINEKESDKNVTSKFDTRHERRSKKCFDWNVMRFNELLNFFQLFFISFYNPLLCMPFNE